MASLFKNYYLKSFAWTSISKLLNAIVGFITVPLLLGLYGKADYGILSLATACNGYMHLLDLGMNVGAVKFFAQWKEEGKQDLIYRVANTNITFYLIIASINVVGLLLIAFWGEPLFNITHEQFSILRECIFILAIFSVFSWLSTPFNQLLISDKQIAYAQRIHAWIPVLKFVLIGLTLYFKFSLTLYFLLLTALTAILVIPYSKKCLKDKLILTLKPKGYWRDFRVVLTYSLSIFAMTLFQATSTQTRPIFLSAFADDGAGAVADFNIIGAVPLFITALSGSMTSIFIPKTSELVARNQRKEIEVFAYRWTVLTSTLICFLCFPFIVGAKEVLIAYVGESYSGLTVWLVTWLFIVICQMHSSPCYSLILSYGKTKNLVISTGAACVVSIVINCSLAGTLGAGSAVVGYAVYILIGLIYNYLTYYKKTLKLNRWIVLKNFFIPVIIGIGVMLIVSFIHIDVANMAFLPERWAYASVFAAKAIAWLVMYIICIFLFKIVRYDRGQIITIYDLK